jgi:DUF971 family protein
METTEHWPTEIRLAPDKRSLKVTFDDGFSAEISAELLRVLSPSAEVQGHSPDQRKTVPGKRMVEIIGIEPVGNYAIRLRFDDMHDTGIYGWGTLRDYGTNQQAMMAQYEAELAAKGMSRERRGA